MYVQKVIDEYKQAGIPPKDVWVQSFEYPDIKQIIDTEREFAKQAVLLDDEVRIENKKRSLCLTVCWPAQCCQLHKQ
jgi:hypothetical protein